MGVFTSLVTEVVIPFSMLSKIVSLACVALSAGQHVSIVGSPEWQAFKNAELAHIAPSVGPLAAAGGNYAQDQLNWLAEQQAIVAAGAGRRKRQVQVVGSPEWQAYKNAELAHIAPSVGPLAAAGRNWHQEQLNYIAEQQAIVAAGAGRRKRQVQVEGSPEWQAYKNAELAFIAPSVGPTPLNYAQSALNFVGPAPGPTPDNYAQAALNFVWPAPGPTPVNYAQSALDFVGPAPGPSCPCTCKSRPGHPQLPAGGPQLHCQWPWEIGSTEERTIVVDAYIINE